MAQSDTPTHDSDIVVRITDVDLPDENDADAQPSANDLCDAVVDALSFGLEDDRRFTGATVVAEVPETAGADAPAEQTAAIRHDVETCVDAEAFLDNVVDTTVSDQSHEQTVECPDCGRTYTFVYMAEGWFDPERKRYTTPPDSVTDQEFPDEAYYEGQTYSEVFEGDEQRWEYVYVLDRLTHNGETVTSF